MSKFVFVLTRGTEDPTRVTRAFQLAKAAVENNHIVNLFLTDEAVLVVKKGMADNIVAPTGDEAASHLAFLTENKIPMYVCTPCAVARLLDESELVENASFAGAPKLFEISEGANIFTF
ncbi:MAG: DsrE family protein [Desulfobacterales bacterium]|nr:DsrE family protein [Desulfobacterales bacterium]MCP4164140.1 DsrE family protein [Deltaproteobacteria bacterium]